VWASIRVVETQPLLEKPARQYSRLVAFRALMIRLRSPRSAYATTRIRFRVDMPRTKKRCSSSECKDQVCSAKEDQQKQRRLPRRTPCFFTLDKAFAGSQSK
jgi:hypothetical protein